MERYYKRKSSLESASSTSHDESPKQSRIESDLPDLPVDPGLRPQIMDYHLNIRDQVRMAYLLKGPCQPRNHNFPQRKIGQSLRRFNPSWFDEFGNWLEYSISKDAAYCLCCYLFKPDVGDQGGGKSFVGDGFSNWKKKERLQTHEGGVKSTHNQAWRKCQYLLNQKQSDEAKDEYRVRLTASIDCIRFLLRQGIPLHGHDDDYENSSNQGNFLELLKFLSDQNENLIDVLSKDVPEYLKFTSPNIQKDIVNAIAVETTNSIVRELGDGIFSILLDESWDVSMEEQIIVALRYVDSMGYVIERFLGIKHVTSTSGALSLKKAVEDLFSTHGLSISRLRVQGYNLVNNIYMRGEFNKLKTLIMKENECAYYFHCLAHKLESTLVEAAKSHIHIATLFSLVSKIVNVIGAPFKHQDSLRDKQVAEVTRALKNDEITSGQGLNQENTLILASDIRQGSHYGTLLSLISMFSDVIDVLDAIVEDGSYSGERAEAFYLLDPIQSFDFVFNLHMMRSILGITNGLSQALQRKDQDIVNAMGLVEVSKQQLQMMRDSGWNSLMDEVSSFCGIHCIDVPNMDDLYVPQGRSRCIDQEITNSHHYRVKLFYFGIDVQLQELNNHFNEVNIELLLCVACLNPSNSFVAFDKQKLIRFAQFYPKDFSAVELMALSN